MVRVGDRLPAQERCRDRRRCQERSCLAPSCRVGSGLHAEPLNHDLRVVIKHGRIVAPVRKDLLGPEALVFGSPAGGSAEDSPSAWATRSSTDPSRVTSTATISIVATGASSESTTVCSSPTNGSGSSSRSQSASRDDVAVFDPCNTAATSRSRSGPGNPNSQTRRGTLAVKRSPGSCRGGSPTSRGLWRYEQAGRRASRDRRRVARQAGHRLRRRPSAAEAARQAR